MYNLKNVKRHFASAVKNCGKRSTGNPIRFSFDSENQLITDGRIMVNAINEIMPIVFEALGNTNSGYIRANGERTKGVYNIAYLKTLPDNARLLIPSGLLVRLSDGDMCEIYRDNLKQDGAIVDIGKVIIREVFLGLFLNIEACLVYINPDKGGILVQNVSGDFLGYTTIFPDTRPLEPLQYFDFRLEAIR